MQGIDFKEKKAEDKKQYNASINAQFRAGQMAGLFIDKKEINAVNKVIQKKP